MVNIQRLWLLQQVANVGTISRVAELEGLTRPAVSQQLAQLERETSLVLLERAGRGVRLTYSAKALLESAAPVFDAISGVEAHLESQREGEIGELRISAFPSVTSSLLPNAIQIMRARFPHLRVNVTELEPSEAFQGIAANRLDVAVVDELAFQSENSHHFEYEPYLVDHLFAVVPEKHRLAARDLIELKDLKYDSWILSSGASRFTQLVIDECHKDGFDPVVSGRCHQVSTMIELVKGGLGVTLLPGLSMQARQEGVAVRPLAVPIVRRIHIVFRRGRRNQGSVSLAIDALHESVGTLGDVGL